MKLTKKFLLLTYNIGFVSKPINLIMQSGFKKNDIVWLKHNYRDRFFADPFLIKQDDNFYYILCEEYIFWEEKGKIVLLTVDKKTFRLSDIRIVLEEKYHLSFPYCKLDGDYFIPESVNGDGTYKYFFNSHFEIVKKEKIYKEGLIDAIFYKSFALACKKINPKSDLYMIDLKNEMNPNNNLVIYSDVRLVRSAGDMFEFNGDLIRPVQDSEGRYGRQTRLIKVKSMDNCYSFEELVVLNSDDNPPFNETCHTFNYYGNIALVDGSKDYFKPCSKVLYKVKRCLINHKGHNNHF